MTSFGLDFRSFERQPQISQLFIIFTHSMKVIFETTETEYIDMNTYHSMIENIVNRNFGNKSHHKNGPNQRQHTNKNVSQKYHHNNNRQHYQNRNTGQKHQHRNPSQQYQPRSFQRH